jgi:hypothetical protein
MRHYALWIMLGIAACCPAGCAGAKRVDVSGKVTYNGMPLNDEGCNIVFLGPNGKSVSAAVAPAGNYKASGVVAGANQVAIYFRNPEAAKSHDPGEKTPPSSSPLRNLPAKYADVKTSELTVDVDTGTVFDVDMKGPNLSRTPQTKAPAKTQKGETKKGRPHKS